MATGLASLKLQERAVIALERIADALQPQAVQAGPDPGACPQCGASPDKIEDRSTLDGTRRDRCTSCGHEWERFPA